MAVITGLVARVAADFSQFDREIEDSAGHLRTLGQTAQKQSRLISTVFRAAAAAGIGAFIDNVQSAERNIAVATGAMGDNLKELNRSFREVFAEVPQGMEEVGNVIGTVNTITGTTGETMERLSKSLLQVSRLLEEDSVRAADSFTKTLNIWNVEAERGEELINKLFSATQQFGVSFTGVSEVLRNSSQTLQILGLNIEESTELIGTLNREGANTQGVMRSMERAARRFADRGLDVRDAMNVMFEEIRNAKNETQAIELASNFFGRRAVEIVGIVRSGVLPSFDALGESLKDQGDSIEDTTGQYTTLGEVTNRISSQIQSLFVPAIDDITSGLLRIEPIVATIVGKLRGFGQGLFDFRDRVQDWARSVGVSFVQAKDDALDSILGILGIIGAFASNLGKSADQAGRQYNTATEQFLIENEVLWLEHGFGVSRVVEDLGGNIEEFFSSTGSSADDMRASILQVFREMVKGSRDTGDSAEDLAKKFNTLKRQIDSTFDVKEQLREGVELLHKSYTKGLIPSTEEYQILIEQLADSVIGAGNDIDTFEKDFENLRRQIDDNYDAKVRLAEGVEILTEAFNRGEINVEEYQEQIENLTDSVLTHEEKTRSILPEIDEVYRSTSRSIFRSFSNLFEDIITKGEISFSNLKDTILSIFARLVAQLASLNLMKALMGGGQGGGFLSQLGSMFGGGGQGGGFLSNIFGGNLGIGGADGVGLGKLGMGAGMLIGANVLGNQLAGSAFGESTATDIGSVIGGILMPFGGIGSFLGGGIGSLFGNTTPPNLSTAGTFGTQGGGEIFQSGETTGPQFQEFAGQVQGFSNMVEQITGDVADLQFHLEIGMRDGILAGIEGLEGLGLEFQRFSSDAEGTIAAKRHFAEAVLRESDSVSDAAANLIMSMQGFGEEFQEFANLVLQVEQMMPEIQALFGDLELEGLVDIADAMGLDRFFSILNRIAEELGKTEELAEISIGKLRNNIEDELGQLGTSVETFWQDLEEAIENGLSEEELKLWMELVPVIDQVTESEEALKKTRQEAAAAIEREQKAADDLNTRLKDRLGLISEEEKKRQQFEEQQRRDRELNEQLFASGAITFSEYTSNLALLEQEQAQFNNRFVDQERKRQEQALRIAEETTRQFQAILRDNARNRAERHVLEQRSIEDIIIGSRRNLGLGFQDLTLTQFEDEIRDLQTEFDRIVAPAAELDPFVDDDLVGSDPTGLDRLDIGRLSRHFRNAGSSLHQLINDFEFFEDQIDGILSGAIEPELAALEAQQRKQIQELRDLRATQAQIRELESLHVKERERLLEELNSAEEEHNTNLGSILNSRRRFLTDLELSIRKITDPFQSQFDQLVVSQQQRLEQAKQLGLDLDRVHRLNNLEQRRLVESVTDPLRDFLTDIRTGEFARLPVVGQLDVAEQQFNRVIQLARRGETDAQTVVQAGRELLRLSEQMFASGPEFFERAQFVERTVENTLSQMEEAAKKQLEEAAKDETLLSIGQEIARGNSMTEEQLSELNQQLRELREVNREMQRELQKMRRAS